VSISPTFYKQHLRSYYYAIKVQTLNVSTKKLHVKLSYEKAECKKLVKLRTESILPKFDFFVFQIFVVKLECLKYTKILSVL
jgi:hypothetical protein